MFAGLAEARGFASALFSSCPEQDVPGATQGRSIREKGEGRFAGACAFSPFLPESPSREIDMGLLDAVRVTANVGGKEIILETGRVARQAHGAVWIQCEGTVALGHSV